MIMRKVADFNSYFCMYIGPRLPAIPVRQIWKLSETVIACMNNKITGNEAQDLCIKQFLG